MKRKRQRLGIRDCRVCGQSLADVCQGCVGVDLAVYALSIAFFPIWFEAPWRGLQGLAGIDVLAAVGYGAYRAYGWAVAELNKRNVEGDQ